MTSIPTHDPRLDELRGAFVAGIIPSDAEDVLSALEALIGVRCLVVWEYHDPWGCGGDCDVYAVAGDGETLQPLSAELVDFLGVYGDVCDDDTALPATLTAGETVDAGDLPAARTRPAGVPVERARFDGGPVRLGHLPYRTRHNAALLTSGQPLD